MAVNVLTACLGGRQPDQCWHVQPCLVLRMKAGSTGIPVSSRSASTPFLYAAEDYAGSAYCHKDFILLFVTSWWFAVINSHPDARLFKDFHLKTIWWANVPAKDASEIKQTIAALFYSSCPSAAVIASRNFTKHKENTKNLRLQSLEHVGVD